MTHHLFALLLIAASLFCASTQGAEPANGFTLIYSGNLNGELEPCGCAKETNLGGIRRRATQLQQLRQAQPDLVLISNGGLIRSDTPRDRINAEFILKGMATLGYDAIGVQWRDLAFGSDMINAADLPWLSSNWLGEGFIPMREIRRPGIKLMAFSWLDPRQSLPADLLGGQTLADTNNAKLVRALQAAKTQGALKLLLTTLTLEQAKAQLPLGLVDILLIGGTSEEYGEPQWLEHTLVLQPGTRGMRLGLADIVLGPDHTIVALAHSVIRLPDTVPDAPYLDGWYGEYNAAIEADYQRRVTLRKARESGDSPYLGAKACRQCHEHAYGKWKESRHAGALEQLQRVNKAFDPFCLGCHTVAFDTPGGFIDASISAHLADVQCESCHGPARAHVRSEGRIRLNPLDWAKEAVCGQCHQGSHSPAFRYEEYWPRIRHGQEADRTVLSP